MTSAQPATLRRSASASRRAARRCRCRSGRAGRGVPPNSAPRGSARLQAAVGLGADRPSNAAHEPPSGVVQPLLLRLGDVQALEVEREAGRGQRAAEAAHQLVVAAAAAEDVAERRVVDLEDRAGVVAEVAQQAEVDAGPGRRRRARASASKVAAEPRGRALDRPRRRARAPRSSTSGPPRSMGSRDQQLALARPPSVERRDLGLEPDEVVGGEALEDRVARLALDPELGAAAGGRGRRRRARSPRGAGRRRRARRPAPRPPRRCPSGAGGADQLDAGLA